ncbi:HAMP domain-containing protein [Phenylobacterium sp.]|uniref:HAMP domain-containing protein n=1 Tax=Phenylobacterium sp. TaxID=1871053 RepID=UPI0027224AE8|nr:HAMP domain-containing protein [Phenylobacterium sp.]MDO8800237.1 HAMP domain-containing protein [Phenylobacterium sp.]
MFNRILLLSVGGLIGVAALLALRMLTGRIVTPIEAIAGYMEKLAAGEYEAEVPFTTRQDEIGDMARSVEIFRQAALERRTLREEQEASRQASETERGRNEDERRRAEQQRAEVTQRLAHAMRGNASELTDQVRRFSTSVSVGATQRAAAKPVPQLRTVGGRGAATAKSPTPEGWEEF